MKIKNRHLHFKLIFKRFMKQLKYNKNYVNYKVILKKMTLTWHKMKFMKARLHTQSV